MSGAMMQAAVAEAPGAPLVIGERAVPKPAAGEVLVRVAAAGLNPLDAKIRAGQAGHAKQPLPAVLGIDMAGTVVTVGEGVTAWQPGDEVFGMVGGVGARQGTLAEFVAADARLLARRPAALSAREAAVLPLIAITAWEGLIDRAQVRAGQRVLVQGGAGGVGHIVVQLARSRGAEVWATGRAWQAQAIKLLGARFIDAAEGAPAYAAATNGEGFDIVFDTLGGAVLDASFQAVRRYTGHVVSILGWGSHSLAPLSFRGATYSGVFTLLPLLTGEGLAHHGQILAEVAKLAEAGRLRPHLDARAFSLTDTEAAYAWMAGGQARGKIAVDVAVDVAADVAA